MSTSQTSLAVPFARSIRFRLSLVIAGVILAAVVASTAWGSWRDFQRAAKGKAETLSAAASGYVAALAEPLAARDQVAASKIMRGVRDLPGVVHVALKDGDGAVLVQMGGGASLRGRDRPLNELEGFDLLGADNAFVSAEVVKGGEHIGEFVILANITDLRADLMASLASTLAAALAAIVGGVLLAQAMIARLTRPIRDLSAMMAQVGSSQDFSQRMPEAKSKDESGVLTTAFNGMLGAINDRDARIAHHVENLEHTVEVRTHDLRLAKEDAEAANAAKSDFLATMSHEIRTPMNGMMVMAEMLAAADLSPRHRRYAEIITRSGAGLLTIINDILDLSKIEAGKLDLEAVPFSPDALVEDVAALFWEKARSKGLSLAIHLAPDVPSMVIGDPTRFNQVITNLVNNALKFTEAGGVTIRVGAKVQGDKCWLEVAVTDTGIGIPAEKIPTIFEAFGQADQSTTRRFGGTGLGLTVCKRLVDAMGGEIVVTSDVGKGSTFAVGASFPIQEAAPQRVNGASLSVAVLVASGIVAKALGRGLKDAGCTVRRIVDVSQAKPGELLLAASGALAATKPGTGVKAICLSDIGDAEADALLRDGVAVDLVSLPVGRRALGELLARAVSNSFRGAAALTNAGAAEARETFTGIKVLAADDNAVNREVLREALLSLGVAADFVENGEQAVAAATTKPYDIIFMDGSMPVMDGFTATARIRAHEGATGAITSRIVALTAQVRGVDADQWAAAGADQHMTKPFTAQRLIEALKAARGAVVVEAVAEPMVEPAVDLIDEAAVETMEGIYRRTGRDTLGKVWKLFLAQAPQSVERLSQGGDASDLARLAHALKSMSLSAGAAAMSRVCEAMEAAAKSGDAAGAMKHGKALPQLMATTEAVMRGRLDAREASVKAG